MSMDIKFSGITYGEREKENHLIHIDFTFKTGIESFTEKAPSSTKGLALRAINYIPAFLGAAKTSYSWQLSTLDCLLAATDTTQNQASARSHSLSQPSQCDFNTRWILASSHKYPFEGHREGYSFIPVPAQYCTYAISLNSTTLKAIECSAQCVCLKIASH